MLVGYLNNSDKSRLQVNRRSEACKRMVSGRPRVWRGESLQKVAKMKYVLYVIVFSAGGVK